MNTFEIIILLTVFNSYDLAGAIDKSPTGNTWSASIQHCRQNGEELVTPLTSNDHNLLKTYVKTEVGKYWTSLHIPTDHTDALGWSGISFYEKIWPNELSWKPGKRPTASDVGSCVALEITKLSIVFYPENCSMSLFSYCRSVDAQTLFTRYAEPTEELNATTPFMTLSGVVDRRACAYECIDNGTCVTYTYLPDTKQCYLFDIKKVEEHKSNTWTVAQCTPLAVSEHGSFVSIEVDVGVNASVMCESPYTSMPIQCQDNGKWSGIPVCAGDMRDCLLGDVSYKGSCYRFSSSAKTWHNASLECEGHGGSLLEIRDSDKMDMVDKMLFLMPNETYWTGGSDEIQTDWWHWSSEYSKMKYTNWHTVSGDPTGHCVQLRRTWGTADYGQFYFDDTDCGDEKHFICEIGRQYVGDSTCKGSSWCRGRARCFWGACNCRTPYGVKVGSGGQPNTVCQRTWSTYTDYGLSMIDEDLPYGIAQEACKRQGGSLMAPLSVNLNTALTQYYTGHGYDRAIYVWSSLKKIGDQYEDLGIKEFSEILEDILPWRRGRETEPYDPGDCVIMEVSKAGGKLFQSSCDVTVPALCTDVNIPVQANVETDTPVSFIPSRSLWTSTELWCGAECLTDSTCKSYGYIAADHMCYLYNDTSVSGPVLTMDYWTRSGCSPITSVVDGNITSGSGLTDINAQIVYTCQTNYHAATSVPVTCEDNGLWSELPRCEPDGPPCPDRWARYGTSCYLIVETELAWSSAASGCESMNSYLVEINTESEKEFLVSFLDFDRKLSVWTGGHDIGLEHWYRWRQYPLNDITVLDWFPGNMNLNSEPTGSYKTKPDGPTIYEDCIELKKQFNQFTADRHYYSDNECKVKQKYLCETKVFNVGSTGCAAYADSPCKGITECINDECRCQYDTYRQTGLDDQENTTCHLIQPVGGEGCMSRNDLCFNVSVCSAHNKCLCPAPLYQNGQDNSFATACDLEQPGCTEDWRGYDNKCYKMFSKVSDENLNPDQDCVKMGATLASPINQDLNDFLLLLGRRSNNWISLHGRELNQLMWADRSVLSGVHNYTNFHDQPLLELSLKETCVYLSMQGTWVKTKCESDRPSSFICAQPKLCRSPPIVSNAISKPTKDFLPVGTVFEYECLPGYVIEGARTGRITCKPTSGSSIWDPEPKCISLLDGIFGPALELFGKPVTPASTTTNDEKCAQMCYELGEGCFAFTFTAPDCQMYTDVSMTLATDYVSLPSTGKKKRTFCPPLPVVSNAVVSVPSRSVDSTAMFTCTPLGRITPGSTLTVKCLETGFWETMPECKDRFKVLKIDVEENFDITKKRHYYNVPSLEDCEMRCVGEKTFRCLSLRYSYGNCFLYQDRIGNKSRKGTANPSSLAVYAEITESDLNEFHTLFNKKMTLTPRNVLTRKSMEECAQACLAESTYDCLTIEYNTVEHSCKLFEAEAQVSVNTEQRNGFYIFKRHIECGNPPLPLGMTSSDLIRKVPDRYSVGDQVQCSCSVLGEGFTGDNPDGVIHCQQGGKWSRLPACRNLCETGWYYWNDNCYQVTDDPQPFKDAYSKCLDQDASLLSVEMPYELSLVEKIRTANSIASSEFWLGLHYSLGMWKWTTFVGNFEALGMLGMTLPTPTRDYAVVTDVSAPSLTAISQTQSYRYVCKRSLPKLQCPDNWYYFNQTCYHVSTTDTASAYAEAESGCSTKGYTLATPHDHQTEDAIKRACQKSGVTVSAYVGLRRLANEDWQYTDGSVLDYKHATGLTGRSLEETCYLVGPATSLSGACDALSPRPYVCQAPIGVVGEATDYGNTPCITDNFCQVAGLKCLGSASGKIFHPPTCRKQECPMWMQFERGLCFHVSSESESYVEATAACGKLGARLMSVGSMEDNLAWLELTERQYGTINGFWIGYDSYVTEDRLKTNPFDSDFQNWIEDQPGDSTPACVVHSRQWDAVNLWMGAACSSLYHYMCEIDVTTDRSTQTAYYEGCFSSEAVPFSSVRKYRKTQTDLDVSSCRTHCSNMGYKYAALMKGIYCSCGNIVDMAVRVQETKCTTPCGGNAAEMCGGKIYLSVYRTTDSDCTRTMPTDLTRPGSCYAMSLSNTNWWAGRFTCGRNGGDLVSVQSIDKQKFLSHYVFTEPGSSGHPVAIGVYEKHDSKGFTYYTTDSVVAHWKYFFSYWELGDKESSTSHLDCAVSDVITGEWKHGLSQDTKHYANFVCEYKEKQQVSAADNQPGNIWRQMVLEKVDSSSQLVLANVTSDIFSSRHKTTTFTSDTSLYCSDLDLGCLNNHQLCPEGFTLLFMVSIDNDVTSDVEIMSTGDCLSSFAIGHGFCVYYMVSTSELVINDATRKTTSRSVRLSVVKDKWYQVAIVFDGNDSMYASLDGSYIQEFTDDTVELLRHTIIYDSILLGNWHQITKDNNIFRLHDVKFKMQKPMWNEITSFDALHFETANFSHWLEGDFGHFLPIKTLPDPGVDGEGMRFSQQGAFAFLSDSRHTCAASLDQCAGDFSLGFWLNVRASSPLTRNILVIGNVAGGKQGLMVTLHESDLHLNLVLSSGLYSGNIGSVSTHTWHHMTLEYRAPDSLSVFMDAVLTATLHVSGGGTDSVASMSSFVVGHVMCPYGWVYAGTSCYYLERTSNSFWNHVNQARTNGSHIIHVDSNQEYNFLLEIMESNSVSEILLGHYDEGRAKKKRFVRVPGKEEDFFPSLMTSGQFCRLDCGGVNCTVKTFWNDKLLAAVYELELDKPEFPVRNACPSGWHYFEHSCYKHLGMTMMSGVTALEECARLWAYPVDINSQDELRFVANLTYSQRPHTHMSYVNVGISRQKMVTGSDIYVQADWSELDWDSWNFSPPTKNFTCVKLQCEYGSCYYRDVECTSDGAFTICERDTGVKCAADWVPSGGECYYKHVETGPVASNFCQLAGYTAVRVKSPDHMERLLYDLDIGDATCLTDATLNGDHYIWNSTGSVTWFDEDFPTKTAPCMSLTGQSANRGFTPTCASDCIICQHDSKPDFSVDRIRFYETALTTSARTMLFNEGNLNLHRISCPMEASNMMSSTSVSCEKTSDDVTTQAILTGSGQVVVVSDTLDRESLTLGTGLTGTFTDGCLDVTSHLRGCTIALWVYVSEDTESVLVDSSGDSSNGIKIAYTNRTLTVEVIEPNYVWSTWTWFPVQDWTYVTLTWQETIGLSLFINAEFLAQTEFGTAQSGYKTVPGASSTLKIGQHVAGSEVLIKGFLHENVMWTDQDIINAYDVSSLKYSVTFDSLYKPHCDNLPLTINDTLTSLVWRNSFFYNSLYVNNPSGDERNPAAISVGQMRNCFTRFESCKLPVTISFWLRPIDYRNPQTYLVAYTSSPMGGAWTVSWEVTYNNTVDLFSFKSVFQKTSYTFSFTIDFLQWSHLHWTATENTVKLFVDGVEQTAPVREHLPSYVHPMQPFSYLEIGTVGQFEIDDIQFYAKHKEPSELYFLRSCHEYKLAGFRGKRHLQVGVNESDVNTVTCEFITDGTFDDGMTVVSHDKMENQSIPTTGGTMLFTYTASTAYLQLLRDESLYCSQKAEFYCTDRALYNGPTNLWTSLDGSSHSYWAGGDDSVSYSCSCSTDNSCEGEGLCNCDPGHTDGVTRLDEGYFSQTHHLPFMSFTTDPDPGTALLILGEFSCVSIGYSGVLVTFEEDNNSTLTLRGILLNFTSTSYTYTDGLSGTALRLENSAFTLMGINTPCFKDLSYCKFGFSFLLWMNIEDVPSRLQVLELGGYSPTQPGVRLTCEAVAGDAERVLCTTLVVGHGKSWTSQFLLQKKRWMHVGVTWNFHRSLSIYLNGQNLSSLGVPQTVTNNLTVTPLVTTSDVKVGHSFAFSNVGTWTVDNLLFVERDVSINEVRKHFGHEPGCVDGWVYNNVTNLCYNITEGTHVLTHDQAEDYCNSHGGMLAVEADSDTHSWLVDSVLNPSGVVSHVHLGLVKTGTSGSYRWSDGRKALHLPTLTETGVITSYCVVLKKSSWQYKSVDCSSGAGALCQKQPLWLPRKEISIGSDNPKYTYTKLSSKNNGDDIEGVVGNTANFSLNFAVGDYADECLNNIRFCHNGWSVKAWLNLNPIAVSTNPEVIFSSQHSNNSYGIVVFGKQDGDFYYVSVVVDDGKNETRTRFEITTYSWVHLYISVSQNTSDIAVFFNGMNNSYIDNVKNTSSGAFPTVGTLVPFSIGATSTGDEQLSGQIDEFEAFEHELLDLDELLEEVSGIRQSSQIEQNFDFNDMLKFHPTTERLPGKFGYAVYIEPDNPVTHKAQFAFECFGSVDKCPKGFTIMMWIQPQINESASVFGIMSSINSHRGVMISYHSSHPVYTSYVHYYWLTVRDGIKEYNFPFKIGDWFWSHVLLTWREGTPVLFVNGYRESVVKTKSLSGDSYPVTLLHFGKADDRITSLGGFSGGVDEFLFRPQSVTDATAVKLYLQTVYVENPFHWNTTVAGLTGNSVILSSLSDYFNLTSSVVGGSCFLQGGSCLHGMTFSIIFRFLGLNDRDQTILTTGGDVLHGTGLYFRLIPNNASMPFRRYFQLGVKTSDKEYSVFFHLKYNEWSQIIAQFHPRQSLKVYVDRQNVGEDPGTARAVSAAGGDRRLLVGKASVEVTEKPNFEIKEINLWDKAVNAGMTGQVEDYMHFVHREINRGRSSVATDISLSDCYSLCSEDNTTECNSFSFCPSIERGDCYLLSDHLTESNLVYTDKCDAFIPVKMPYLDYFKFCISDSAVTSLAVASNVINWEECRHVCHAAGNQYSGVFNGSDCYCDDSLGEETPIATSSCDIVCSTLHTETCGGMGALSVYVTGSWQPFIAPTVPISGLNVMTDPGLTVGIGDAIKLQMDVNANTYAGYLISSPAIASSFYTGFNTTNITVVTAGRFTLTVRALNEISFKDYITEVLVFVPLSNMSFSHKNIAKTAEVIIFTATVTDGTNITCDINYGDGNIGSLFKVDDSTPFFFTHGFAAAGVYDISITCFNDISSIMKQNNIIIQDVVSNLQMTTNTPVRHPGPLNAVWSIDTGTNVTFTLFLDSSVTNLETYVYGSLSGSAIVPQPVYDQTGQHDIILRAANLVSLEFIHASVIIEIPIDTLSINPNGTYHVINVPVEFTVKLAKGSNLSIWLHLDDSSTVELTSDSNSINHVIKYLYSYDYTGLVEVNLTVSNIHGVVSAACMVIIEVSVEEVVMTADDIFNPVDYELQVLFTVSSPSQKPTDALIDIDFGDTSTVSDIQSSMPALFQNITHKYITHGVFLVNISIHNNVSTKSLMKYVKVGGPIANLSVTINRMFIPFGSPLILTSDVEYGSLISYQYNFGDDTPLIQSNTKSYPTAANTVSHMYNDTLDYIVHVTASNSFNSDMKSLSVHVQERVEGLILTSNAPVRANTTMTFILTMVSAGTDTCFVWDFNDGTKVLYGVPSCPLRPEYANMKYEHKVGPIMTVVHTYHFEASYNVSVNSSNEVSWDFVSQTVSALEYICIEPKVQILGLQKNSISPVNLKRSNRFKISANIDTQCVPPVNTVYTWVIQKVSVSGNTTHQDVQVMTEILSPQNGLPSMTIPGNYLEYGIYKISLTVSYEKGSSLSTTDHSFIKIVPSQLVVSIVGDNYRTVYIGDDLVLSANSSHDPDFSNGQMKGLMYKWYCHLVEETLPRDSSGLPLDILNHTTSGCFGNGFGFLGQTAETMMVNSSDLVGQIYVFTLVISKDTRVSQMEQRVHVLTTSVSHIFIRCADNCGIKTTGNQPLRLVSVCTDCTSQGQLAQPYLWELFIIEPDHSYLPVNLSSWTSTEESENSTDESGLTNPNIMISPGLLVPGMDYRVRLTSGTLITEKQLNINYPPYDGQCYPNRQLGMEFETKFMIFCENWLDEGDRPAPNPEQDKLYKEPITFKFSYKIRGSASEPHVFYEVTGSNVHTPELFLRGGLAEEDYMVDILVSVSDSGGAYNVTKLTIKVIEHPDFVMEVYNSLKYQRLEAEKDITAILLINMGVIERLNELRSTNTSSTPVTVQMIESVVHHLAEHIDWVETPVQVELVVDILDAVLQDPEQLSLNTRTQALSVYRTLFNSLDSIFNESSDSVTQQRLSKAMMGSFIKLMMANRFTLNCKSSDCQDKRNLADSTQSVFESRDSLVRLMLKGAVAGEPPVYFYSENGDLTYHLERKMTSRLTNSSVQINKKQAVEFPDIAKELPHLSIDLEIMESPKLQTDTNSVVQSRTTGVTLYNHGRKLEIQDLQKPVRVSVHCIKDIPTETIDIAENYTGSPFYIEIALERSDVRVTVQLAPEDAENATFEYFASYNTVPTKVVNELNGTLTLKNETEADEQWTLVFDVWSFSGESVQKKLKETSSFYIGLLPLHNMNTTSSVLNVTIFSAGCQYWDVKSRAWKNNGLQHGGKTDKTKVECLTTHLTSFGASFFVPPNTINFKSVFSKFSDIGSNAAVFSTVIVVIGLYLIGIIFVRRADKKDVVRWSVLPLLDNLPSDVYHYQVTVFTGMRRSAGTKSRVFFVLGGEDGDTEIRAMEADKKKQHDRGSVNSYILSVPQTLGHLLFIRIWHDMSGKGTDSDWYLSLVLVKDLQTDEKYVFLCDRWLAVDKDDGEVERFLPISTKEDLESFGHLFGFKACQDLTDGHLWFSVASRPTWSNFTRVQRLSCCLSLLFTTMVANAMWYGTTPSEGTQDVHLGPFTFSPQELTTSLLMSLIVVPVNLLIVTLFRKAGPKSAKECKKQSKNSVKHDDRGCPDLPRTVTPSGIFTIETCQKKDLGSRDGKTATRSSKSKRSCCLFPYWVSYIAWFLVIVSIVAPAFFTILYSLEWGADKSSRWLTSFVLSFVESVLLIQPIKVLAVALVLALIFKKMDFIEEGPAEEQEGETIVYSEPGQGGYGSYAHPLKPAHRRPYVEKPPDFSTINNVRNYRKKQNRLVDIVKEIGTYIFYLIIVAIICYENRDENSFRIVDNIKNLMVKDISPVGPAGLDRGFDGISSFDNFWDWSVERLIPALYVQTDFNGDSLPPSRMTHLNDHVNYRVGPPRLRQARVLNDTCKIPSALGHLIHTCIAEYGVSNYEDQSYDVGWTPLKTSNTTSSPGPWMYQSVVQLGGIPAVGDFGTYGGGGYVAVLGNDNTTAKDMLMHLKDNRWIDRQTRAVLLEVNLYNPYVNLFCAVSLLLEIPPTGSAISFTHITPLRLYRYVGPSALFMIITDLIFVVFTIYFLVRLVREIKTKGRKYLCSFWNCIEFLNVMAAILCCAFYGVHFVTTAFTLDDFHHHTGDFINFQLIVHWDEVFAFIQGFLLFFSMIKLLRLIRFNAKVTQLSTTLRKAVGPIFNFFIVFVLVFMAFTQFAYLVFGPVSHEYFSFLTSLETLFSMLLMKVDIEQVMVANSTLGPIFLFLFILVVVFILLNMLLSILNEVFTEVRVDKNCRPDDPEMVDFMISEIKRVVGITGVSKSVQKMNPRNNSKIHTATMLTDVERWLAEEKDRFSPDLSDGEYEKATPPNSTDLTLRDLSKRDFYLLQSKDWLKTMGLPNYQKHS